MGTDWPYQHGLFGLAAMGRIGQSIGKYAVDAGSLWAGGHDIMRVIPTDKVSGGAPIFGQTDGQGGWRP